MRQEIIDKVKEIEAMAKDRFKDYPFTIVITLWQDSDYQIEVHCTRYLHRHKIKMSLYYIDSEGDIEYREKWY